MLQTPITPDQPTTKKNRLLFSLLSGVLVLAVLAGALVFSVTTRSDGAHAASAVVTKCQVNQSTEPANNPVGVTLFWIRLKTTWCWNGTIVTKSSTVLYWGVTTTGKLTLWILESQPNYFSNCYVAAGSKRNCSGNHEYMNAQFFNGGETCGLELQQWETYNHKFTAKGSKFDC